MLVFQFFYFFWVAFDLYYDPSTLQIFAISDHFFTIPVKKLNSEDVYGLYQELNSPRKFISQLSLLFKIYSAVI